LNDHNSTHSHSEQLDRAWLLLLLLLLPLLMTIAVVVTTSDEGAARNATTTRGEFKQRARGTLGGQSSVGVCFCCTLHY